jgi:hypothetical protein
LDGYDFVVKTVDGGIEVTVVGSSYAFRASPEFQIAERSVRAIPEQPLPAIEVVQSPAGRGDSNPVRPSFTIVEPKVSSANPPPSAVQPSPEIAADEPPVGPTGPNNISLRSASAAVEHSVRTPQRAALLSHSRSGDHLRVAGETGSRHLLPHRIKVATATLRWRNSHERTILAYGSIFCVRHSLTPMIPDSWYPWVRWEVPRTTWRVHRPRVTSAHRNTVGLFGNSIAAGSIVVG